MHSGLSGNLAVLDVLTTWLTNGYLILKVVIGFSVIIFVHELGHFLAAKWMGIRVDRFAVGFFYRLCGWRRGEGLTFGRRPSYKPEELTAKGWGETDYCFNALPFGGYVKMLGQDDIDINEETGEVKTSNDPRAFPNKSVSRRAVVVSAGVVFNVLFAILLFVLVFLLLGKNVNSPEVGVTEPGSAAEKAGLLPGDRILAVDGHRVTSFDDVIMWVVLSSGAVHVQVERQGKPLDHELVVNLENRGRRELLGIAPELTAQLSSNPTDDASKPGPRAGDKIIRVNGIPVDNAYKIYEVFQGCNGQDVALTVERAERASPGKTQTFTFAQRPVLQIAPAVENRDGEAQTRDSQHVLGLRRRWAVVLVTEKSPADRAHFKPGDVIAQWGSVANPIYSEIIASINANDGQPIPVVVERAGQPVHLAVTPRREFRLFGSAPPKVGLLFDGDDGRPIVADVAPGTPAARLGMPRGAEIVALNQQPVHNGFELFEVLKAAVGTTVAEIVALNEQPVHNWFDLLEALKAAAGTTISLRYRSGSDEATGRMTVPSSIVNELNLPPTAKILAINGEDSVTLESGKSVRLPAYFAVQKLLEKKVGQTVEVTYKPGLFDTECVQRAFTVRSDNTDPWQMRCVYTCERLTLAPKKEPMLARGEPLRALSLGLQQTYTILYQVYGIAKGMVASWLTGQGDLGVQNVAGPVGIFRFAYQQAEAGYGDLFFFLAFLSLNLAVLNFIPLPVVDGGLMVFLLLEKVRGKPLSVKVQVITTLAGLALIVLTFVFVTFNDIVRWWNGGL